MTAKEQVLAVYPYAHCYPQDYGNRQRFIVADTQNWDCKRIGKGTSEEAAWQNAAESLPAQREEFCEDPYCFGDHCGLKVNPKTELKAISVESIGEPGDYACAMCHRPYTAKDVEGWTIKCPTCKGHSGDPYSHEPFYCATCGGMGKVLAFPVTKEVIR